MYGISPEQLGVTPDSAESNDSPRGPDITYAELDGVAVNPHMLQPLSDDDDDDDEW